MPRRGEPPNQRRTAAPYTRSGEPPNQVRTTQQTGGTTAPMDGWHQRLVREFRANTDPTNTNVTPSNTGRAPTTPSAAAAMLPATAEQLSAYGEQQRALQLGFADMEAQTAADRGDIQAQLEAMLAQIGRDTRRSEAVARDRLAGAGLAASPAAMGSALDALRRGAQQSQVQAQQQAVEQESGLAQQLAAARRERDLQLAQLEAWMARQRGENAQRLWS